MTRNSDFSHRVVTFGGQPIDIGICDRGLGLIIDLRLQGPKTAVTATLDTCDAIHLARILLILHQKCITANQTEEYKKMVESCRHARRDTSLKGRL